MADRLLSIIIPAFNERRTIADLLDRVMGVALPGIQKQIIVVESLSADGTRDIVKSYEAQGKIEAIYEDRPQGKGHAVKAGLARARGEWILIQDADLEYDVHDYPRLLEPLVKGETAFVLGSRHLGNGWAYRAHSVDIALLTFINIGVWCFTQLFNGVYGVRLTDPCTMFKVFRRDCLEGVHFQSNGFDLDWEIVGKLIRKGFRPKELPVSYQSRNWKEGKKTVLWRDGWISIAAILRFRFGSL